MLQLNNSIFSLYFGRDNFEYCHFSPRGIEQIYTIPTPWEQDIKDNLIWPMGFVEEFCDHMSRVVSDSDILAPAVHNANLIFTGRKTTRPEDHEQVYLKPIDTSSVTEQHLYRGLVGTTQHSNRPEEIFERQRKAYFISNGASIHPHQIAGQIGAFSMERFGHITECFQITTVAAVITSLLTDEIGNTRQMLRAVGFDSREAASFYDDFLPEVFTSFMGRQFEKTCLLECKRKFPQRFLVMPTEYGPSFARQVAFAQGHDWVVDTDNLSVAVRINDNVQPNERTYNAGIGFEGIGENRCAVSYWSADTKDGFEISPIFLNITEVMADALGLERPVKAAAIGNIVESEYFCYHLDLCGLHNLRFRFDSIARHAGLAAEALRRRHANTGMTFEQALKSLPTKILQPS